MDVEAVKRIAKEEYNAELFRQAVEHEKQRLRTHVSLWDRLFPWKLIVWRKDNYYGKEV